VSTRFVGGMSNSVAPYFECAELAVEANGLLKRDPRNRLFPPLHRSEGYGEFVYSVSESTSTTAVYTKVVNNTQTGLPRAWARLEINRDGCTPASYTDGGYSGGAEFTAIHWEATYAPGAVHPVHVALGPNGETSEFPQGHAFSIRE